MDDDTNQPDLSATGLSDLVCELMRELRTTSDLLKRAAADTQAIADQLAGNAAVYGKLAEKIDFLAPLLQRMYDHPTGDPAGGRRSTGTGAARLDGVDSAPNQLSFLKIFSLPQEELKSIEGPDLMQRIRDFYSSIPSVKQNGIGIAITNDSFYSARDIATFIDRGKGQISNDAHNGKLRRASRGRYAGTEVFRYSLIKRLREAKMVNAATAGGYLLVDVPIIKRLMQLGLLDTRLRDGMIHAMSYQSLVDKIFALEGSKNPAPVPPPPPPPEPDSIPVKHQPCFGADGTEYIPLSKTNLPPNSYSTKSDMKEPYKSANEIRSLNRDSLIYVNKGDADRLALGLMLRENGHTLDKVRERTGMGIAQIDNILDKTPFSPIILSRRNPDSLEPDAEIRTAYLIPGMGNFLKFFQGHENLGPGVLSAASDLSRTYGLLWSHTQIRDISGTLSEKGNLMKGDGEKNLDRFPSLVDGNMVTRYNPLHVIAYIQFGVHF